MLAISASVSQLEERRPAWPAPGRSERPARGTGQWVLLRPPSREVLASRRLTNASRDRRLPFTTRTPQPGMMEFEDVQVQLVDAPAVAAGRTEAP
jgi:ribosome-interacting GTPase 1